MQDLITPSSSINFVSQKSGNVKIENMASELGLVNVWAYHCYRCNYTWLPRDFDLDSSEPFKMDRSKWLQLGQELLYRLPPKSCARCKSRSWKFPPHTGSELGESKARIRALKRRKKLTTENLIRNLNNLQRIGALKF